MALTLCVIKTSSINPSKIDSKAISELFSVEEDFIFSRLNSTIKSVNDCFESMRLNEVPLLIENLFLDLSRAYIQLVRDKSAVGSVDEKQVVAYTTYTVMLECFKMLSTVTPFISERMYLNFKSAFGIKEESINLSDWPVWNEKLIDEQLERNMLIADNIVQAALAAREKAQLGVRWPVKNIEVVTSDETVESAVESMEDLIKLQANVKEIHVHKKLPRMRETVSVDHGNVGKMFGALSTKILAKLSLVSASKLIESLSREGKVVVLLDSERVELAKDLFIVNQLVPDEFVVGEFKNGKVFLNKIMDSGLESEGFSRELMRRVQSLRKNAGLEKNNRIDLFVKMNAEMRSRLSQWKDKIAEKVGASSIAFEISLPSKAFKQKNVEKIKNEEFEVFFDVI